MIDFQELISSLHDNLVYAFDMGEDDVISFPVLIKSKKEKIQEAFFIYSISGVAETGWSQSTPHKWFKLCSDSGVLEFFATCSEQDFYIPTETIGEHKELSFEEYERRKTTLYELHEDVRKFAFLDKIYESEKNLLDDYNTLFYDTMPESLIPYYKSLRKSFDDWAESVTVVEDFEMPNFEDDFPIISFSEASDIYGELDESGDTENK